MPEHSVACIALSRTQAELIVERLRHAGFAREHISALFADTDSSRSFAHKKGTKAPEGTVAGGGTGGVIGGTVGLLAGIGALSIPGIGALVAAGPILATLSGAAVGVAVGSLTGALIGMGFPEYVAKRYEGKIKIGNILIALHVHNSHEADLAKRIYEESGAEDISTMGEVAVGKLN